MNNQTNQLLLVLDDNSTATLTISTTDSTRTIQYSANGAKFTVPVGCVVNLYSVQRVYNALCGKH